MFPKKRREDELRKSAPRRVGPEFCVYALQHLGPELCVSATRRLRPEFGVSASHRPTPARGIAALQRLRPEFSVSVSAASEKSKRRTQRLSVAAPPSGLRSLGVVMGFHLGNRTSRREDAFRNRIRSDECPSRSRGDKQTKSRIQRLINSFNT